MTLVRRKITAIVPNLLEWFTAHARDLPWRNTSDPYGIWISEIMLQQTQVKTVWPYWERWMHALPNIQSLAKASSQKIHKLWEGLGYYSRVRNLQLAAGEIVRTHDAKFPRNYLSVLELPGIGPYTAGAICSIAFDQPTPILDGNVMRVLTRIFCLEGNPRKPPLNQRLWKLSEGFVAQAAGLRKATLNARPCSQLNQALMELGALICTPRQPRCGICPIRQLCRAYQTGTTDQFPQLPERAAPTKIRSAAFVVSDRGRYFVRQRSAGIVNGHLWEFPNRQIMSDAVSLPQLARKECAFPVGNLEPLFTIRHSITRYRHTLDVFRARRSAKKLRSGNWFTLEELEQLPFSSAHKKILSHLSNPRQPTPFDFASPVSE